MRQKSDLLRGRGRSIRSTYERPAAIVTPNVPTSRMLRSYVIAWPSSVAWAGRSAASSSPAAFGSSCASLTIAPRRSG